MEILELAIPHAWLISPQQFPDERGLFLESFKNSALAKAVGHELTVAQVNCSVSRRGVLRGIHAATVPPGQAKYITCLRGAVVDVVVDIRVGSPTFGRYATVRLDDADRRAVYVSEGLGHGFMALTDDATVMYLCSTPFNPAGEFGVDPLDPEVGVAWPPELEPVLSPKDATAPSLAEAAAEGLLPTYQACLAFYERLRSRGALRSGQ
jgi:dTDP-4-dehydrorhamnose 3,5-epimerase